LSEKAPTVRWALRSETHSLRLSEIMTSGHTNLNTHTLAVLIVTAVGAYLIAQALWAAFRWCSQLLRPAAEQRYWRIVLIAAVGIFGLLMVWLATQYSGNAPALGWSAVWFVLSAGFFFGGRALLQGFIVNFFSDIQIYTTRDENNAFFKARSEILKTVSDALAHFCSKDACQGSAYERVFVFGHSLGSTISMDAIIQFYQSCEQGSRQWDDYRRLRGFVTFGTSLEKTKYFFDVQNPSLSASYEQWRNDAYGVLFTPNQTDLDSPRSSLDIGVFWANYWYFLDVISNSIDSYRSYLVPGEAVRDAQAIREEIASSLPPGQASIPRLVCNDVNLWHFFSLPSVIPHGDYLHDENFWRRNSKLDVLDIVARKGFMGGRGPGGGPGPLPTGGIPPPFKNEGPSAGAGDLTETELRQSMKPRASLARDEGDALFEEPQRVARRAHIEVESRVQVVSPRDAWRYLDHYEGAAKTAPTTGATAGTPKREKEQIED
jgi:hypothetical protein